MKLIFALVISCLMTVQVQAERLTLSLRAAAESCAQAAVSKDYNTMLKYTHPRMIKQMGGKDAMLAILQKGMDSLEQNGISFESCTIKKNEEPKRIGKLLTAIVEESIVLNVPEGKAHIESALLGISEDDGKSWVFIDLGHATPEILKKIVPELVGKIKIPPKRQPVIQKN